jgi:hypothetical protein
MKQFIAVAGNNIVLREATQVSPALPSDKNRVKLKTLERLQAVARDRGRGILTVYINVEL